MQFDPRDPAFRLDPYPTYALLREHAPIYFWPTWGIWFISSHADCAALLRDARVGREETTNSASSPEEAALYAMMSRWMLLLDPPDHTRLRGLVHKAFTPRMVAQLRDRVQAIANQLLDQVQDQGRMDLIADFAYPLPVTVICALLGIPPSDHRFFHGWSDAIAKSLDLTDESEVYVQASTAAAELTTYLDGLLAERRRKPQADLFSALVAVEAEGERLSREELFATCALLLIAGHETTVNLIGNGTLALLRNRAQWDLLAANPILAESAVEELLRYDSPVQMTSRRVQEQFSYRGSTFEVGQQVAFLLGSANRDPANFAEPDRLDITRESKSHLAFGSGIHYCLGAPLARLEGAIAFAALTRRCPNLALDEETVRYRDNYALRGLEKLMVARTFS
jgi:cytochrome P450